jgi:hypothetical protein
MPVITLLIITQLFIFILNILLILVLWHLLCYSYSYWAGVAQSMYCPTSDWTTGVRSLAETKDFSFRLCVQTGSEAHPASCTMGTDGPFPGVMRGSGVTLATHPHLSRGQEWVGAYIASPPKRLHGV